MIYLQAIVLLVFVAKFQFVSSRSSCVLVPHFEEFSSTACKITSEDTAMINLKIIATNSKLKHATTIDFISTALARNHSEYSDAPGEGCSEVIGVVGDLDLKTANIIHALASRANLNITLVSAVAPSTFLPTTHLALPNLLHMNPLTHYVEALAAFFDHLNWTRVGLISDNTPYYEFAAELIKEKLLTNTERSIVPDVKIRESTNRTRTVQTFETFKTDVIVISASVKTACSLVREAGRVGLSWPHYAWILLDVNFDITRSCPEDGVIILRDHSIIKKSRNYKVKCNDGLKSKMLTSRVLLDSVMAVAAARERSLMNASFLGAGGLVKLREGRRLTNISVALISSSKFREEIGIYNAESSVLTYLNPLPARKPRGTILVVHFRDDQHYTLQITLLMLAFSLSFIFLTAVFILYIYFHKKPEIKATSVTVSLSMFLGCYIMILYLPLLAVDPTGNFHCNLLLWLSLGGIPVPLITATLIAKMLRVYLLFSDPLSFKKKLFTDPFLLMYILFLLSPTLFLLIIWTSYDPPTLVQTESLQENYIFKYGRCQSNKSIKWVSLIFYSFMLSVALMCLALKTSKVRRKHFKDTKATNAFVYLSSFAIIITSIYWYFFRLQELNAATLTTTGVVLFAGHIGVVLLCQLLLFVPKVYPPLKRRLAQKWG